MLETFKNIKDPALKGLIVWEPMVKGDTTLDAAELVTNEKRFVMQGWDSKVSVGEALATTLHLNCPAWDVYLLYEPGIRWTGDVAPMPSFWMHQLGQQSGADPALHLVPAKLESEIQRRLLANEHSSR